MSLIEVKVSGTNIVLIGNAYYIEDTVAEYCRTNKLTGNIRIQSDDIDIAYTYQNGNLHSENDAPAIHKTRGRYQTDLNIKEWYRHGKLHRDEDLPAITTDTDQRWYECGLPHRINNPAEITDVGTKWYTRGKLHRENGPAVDSEYLKEYRIDGLLHRIDGPALINKRYGKADSWYLHGVLHREDGPATTDWCGNNSYHLNGHKFNNFANLQKYIKRGVRKLLNIASRDELTLYDKECLKLYFDNPQYERFKLKILAAIS